MSNNLSRFITRAKPGFIFPHHGKRTLKGFTLVELLVVIAIIGILAAVVMIAINPLEMMRKGRDSTRLQDMENVRKAIDMEIATNPNAAIPSTNPCVAGRQCQSNNDGNTCAASGGWVRGPYLDLCTYIATLPIDPHGNDSSWHYEFQADGNNYELRCKLESKANFDKARYDGGSDNTCSDDVTGGGPDCWYEVGTDPGLNLID